MGYYRQQELPFQFALANAFTLCDAYHCSIHAGTNTNRLFHWTGTNGPSAADVAVVVNEWDSPGPADSGYQWTTYPERLEASGVSWKVYQFLPDNFTDNPLAGFRQYRAASIQVGNPAWPPKDFNAFVPYSDALNEAAPLYKGNGNTLPAATATIWTPCWPDSARRAAGQTAAGQLDHRAGGLFGTPRSLQPGTGRLVHPRDPQRADRQPGGVE
ncbi:hypothetical protein AK51_04885 [Serratia nematodiphila DZ0503SBS1]|nr:hypothetical protein AK51_04885 [Serratia nematodiphila DZ0503SBS1]